MKSVILVFLSWLVIVNASFAAFPLTEKQPLKAEVIVQYDENNSQTITRPPGTIAIQSETFLNKLHNKYLSLADPHDQYYEQNKNGWMGPVSFILMFIPYGFLVGIPFAIIARVRRYKNRGWALAALLIYPAAFVVALTVFIFMFIV